MLIVASCPGNTCRGTYPGRKGPVSGVDDASFGVEDLGFGVVSLGVHLWALVQDFDLGASPTSLCTVGWLSKLWSLFGYPEY